MGQRGGRVGCRAAGGESRVGRTVYVVPHTHWDREWYQPHELFRWRLAQMIDELLEHMETHPEFRCFNLDGQSIVIADYLELRPENEGRLRRMIEDGRILIGPWWVQPDEFLPSGESHIRSFQKGIRFAERMGGSLRIGHCADQFGHIAQMPQLMSQLGLTSACLWRGVPDSVPGWSFWWEAPDGTRLPVLYLRNSYSSGWRLPSEPEDLLERTRRQERYRRDDEPALLMNGTDHSRMEKHLPGILAAAGGLGYEYLIATLADYERTMFEAGIDEHVHSGELRSPDRSNVLVGVLSSRMNIKQRDFQVSAALERYAEPMELLARMHGGGDGLPALKQAWRLLLENSPHDSICGCSVDQTHREMFPRYDRAEQLARQIARESMGHLVKRIECPAEGGVVVWRPVPHAPGVLECEVPGDWEAVALRLGDGATVACALGPVVDGEVLFEEETTPWGAVRHLNFVREDRWDAHHVEAMDWELEGGVVGVETTVGDDLNVVDDAEVRREVREVAANELAERAVVRVRRSSRRWLRAVLPASGTVGVEMWTPVRELRDGSRIAVTGNGIENGFYRVCLDKKGRLRVEERDGLVLDNVNAFVDEGDRGDEYNAEILPDAVSRPSSVEVLGVEQDGVSATLRYRTVLEAPAGLTPGRMRRQRKAVRALVILTEVRLWAEVPRVGFRVTVENTAEDHRLRALFPLPFGVTRAITENQFHVAKRGVEPAPWNGVSAELPPTTFPQKTFAAFEQDGQGVAVFNKGLQEGEVVRDRRGRHAYALTLLRCVGWLSRNDLVSRRGGAGPSIATFDSQMPGRHAFEYSLMTYRGTWREAGVQAMAHSFAFPPMAWATNRHEGSHRGVLPLATFRPEAVVPSAMHRSDEDGAPIIRVYNASDEDVVARIEVPAVAGGAELVDLLERPVGEVPGDGVYEFPLRAWGIASLRLR